jgi:hypothetical protein
MQILQTCWLNDPKKLDAGWLSTKYHLMSWALSCWTSLKYNGSAHLVSDVRSADLLLGSLQLPYQSVNTSLEDFTSPYDAKRLWVLKKLFAYALPNEPFIHLDGDAYLFMPLSENLLNASLVAQNVEDNHPYYISGIAQIEEHFAYIPDYLLADLDGKYSSVNAGLIGGRDFDFHKRVYREVNLFLEKNESNLLKIESFALNVIIEQMFFKKLADSEEIPIDYILGHKVGYPCNYQLDRFWDLPNSCDYLHIMNYKQNHTICEQMAQRLYIESPELYEMVVKVANQLEATKVSMFVENKENVIQSIFYRSQIISQALGLSFPSETVENNTLNEWIENLPENPQKTILQDVFRYESEKQEFLQNLPALDEYVQYRKQQSLEVNEVLSKSEEEILASSVTFGEHVALIESEWKWAEKNEFTGQDDAVDYTLNLAQEPSYFQVVLFCYPVSMLVKEQLSETLTILIIDSLQDVDDNRLTINEMLENVSQEIYSLNQSIGLEELRANTLTKIRYLLYQGILAF